MTTHPAPNLCGMARDKAELFRERYTILQQVRHLNQHSLVTSLLILPEILLCIEPESVLIPEHAVYSAKPDVFVLKFCVCMKSLGKAKHQASISVFLCSA